MEQAPLSDAIREFERTLEQVTDGDWAAATPCVQWDVRTLVNHVLGELLWIPPLLDGATIAEVGDRLDGDVLGADPVAAFRSGAAGAREAAARPGVQERTVHLSFGDFSGAEYLGQVTSDVIIHTWDLARGVGADDRLDPGLVQFAADFLRPQVELWRSAGAFGPAAEVGADADAQDQFLAQTGRSSDWAP